MAEGAGVVERAESHAPWVAAFESLAAGRTSEPAWLTERRRQAIDSYATVGFPTTHEEAWRFTSVEPIIRGTYGRAEGGAVSRRALEPYCIGGTDRVTAVVVNGRYAPELSSRGALPDGAVIGSLAEAIASGDPAVERHLSRHASIKANPFTALNAAFVTDGVFVSIPNDAVLERPVQILYVTTGETPIVSHPRTLVVAGSGAQASIIETFVGVGTGTAPYWTNAASEIVLGENATVDTYRIQHESEVAFQTAVTQSYQGRDSVYSIVAFVFGAALSRHDVNAVIDGPGAEATLNGLSVLRDRQHADHHTTIEHAQPHCNSWEFFNGIYDDNARGVFNGRIIVRPGAQRTDSKQTNNNLLLSNNARADSQPQLEIYADDVKCTHGATLGPIDPRAMFYLRSRGLDEAEARNLLTYGFAAEILGYVTLTELRERLDQTVHARLEEGARRRSAAA